MTEETAKALIEAMRQLTAAIYQLTGNGASSGGSTYGSCGYQPPSQPFTGGRGFTTSP